MEPNLKLAGIVGLMLVSTLASAESVQVVIDPGQTRVSWSLGATMHTVHGTFKMKNGTVILDPRSGEASGAIVIDATSGESGNADRDKDMHSKVLQSAQYPEITFFPKRVIGNVPDQGTGNIQLQGVLRIHGSDHDLTLAMPIERAGDQIKANFGFVVPYQDWGMKNPSKMFLHVENKVSLEIATAGKITATSATPAN